MAFLRSFTKSLLCLALLAGPAWAQDGDRIWGRVHTTAGDVYEGFIRWDRNEGSWVDILDGSKTIPPENYQAWLEARDRDGPALRYIELLGHRISWVDTDPDFPSISASGIRFGHLRSLRVVEDGDVELTLRSGEVVEFIDRSSDLGNSNRGIVVDVPRRAEIDLDWSDLDRIVFSASPPGVRARARRLYGTVEDREGRRFTGYISWDVDEILASDELGGEEMEGRDDRDIPFGEIASITRIRRGARVVLVNGEQVDLTGTNDVDRGNRGIQISDPALGMVEVEWREFESLRFHEADAVVGYDAFDGGHLLVGTVVTQSGEEIQGMIRWDADEASSWELLNGRADKVIFSIEFSQVSSIEQEGAFGSTVTLRDGRTFRLDDANDVDRDNRGILIAPEVVGGGADSDVPDSDVPAPGATATAGTPWRVVAWDDFREVRFRIDATVGSGR